jgi:hypothetical protein
LRLAYLRDVVDGEPGGFVDDDGPETRSDNVAGGEAYLIAKKRGFNGFPDDRGETRKRVDGQSRARRGPQVRFP